MYDALFRAGVPGGPLSRPRDGYQSSTGSKIHLDRGCSSITYATATRIVLTETPSARLCSRCVDKPPSDIGDYVRVAHQVMDWSREFRDVLDTLSADPTADVSNLKPNAWLHVDACLFTLEHRLLSPEVELGTWALNEVVPVLRQVRDLLWAHPHAPAFTRPGWLDRTIAAHRLGATTYPYGSLHEKMPTTCLGSVTQNAPQGGGFTPGYWGHGKTVAALRQAYLDEWVASGDKEAARILAIAAGAAHARTVPPTDVKQLPADWLLTATVTGRQAVTLGEAIELAWHGHAVDAGVVPLVDALATMLGPLPNGFGARLRMVLVPAHLATADVRRATLVARMLRELTRTVVDVNGDAHLVLIVDETVLGVLNELLPSRGYVAHWGLVSGSEDDDTLRTAVHLHLTMTDVPREEAVKLARSLAV